MSYRRLVGAIAHPARIAFILTMLMTSTSWDTALGASLSDVNAKALGALASTDSHAYVRTVQSALRSIGDYRGEANGILGKPTVRAILKFCAAAGILADCQAGPFSGRGSKALANALAAALRGQANTIPQSTPQGAVRGDPGRPPDGWSLAPEQDGVRSEVVSISTREVVIKFKGVATQTGFTDIAFSSTNEIPAVSGSRWTASVVARTDGTAQIPTLQTALWNDNQYQGELFDGVPLSSGNFSKEISAAGTVPPGVAYLQPYVQVRYAQGATLDLTVWLSKPSLRKLSE
jgi:peptidoglycan hydrolase-like protein with peptidoglycan-binding domain